VGQGQENFLRIADQVAVARVAKLPGHGDQSRQVRLAGELGYVFGAYSMSLTDSLEETAHHPPSLRQSRGKGKKWPNCRIGINVTGR
jgi:hypothetical protein